MQLMKKALTECYVRGVTEVWCELYSLGGGLRCCERSEG